ncbi:MAG: hypothetical protein MRY21_03300 [Simkaniaceae bacterium]|nr:hypothetical protein [Simkaniaceae bacterium]
MYAALAALPCVCHMPMEQRVGQVMMPCFVGEEFNSDAKALVSELHVGGIILYNWANGMTKRKQVVNLTSSLQREATIPLLIATDQEGGLVQRWRETEFPGARALGVANNVALTQMTALAMGEDLRSLGIHAGLSPVLDVDVDGNPVIGVRSFGEDVDTVVKHGKAFSKGLKKAGVLSVGKHAPGHGSTKVDSHYCMPVITKTLAELRAKDLRPFFEIELDAIMTGHLFIPDIDPNNCATFSSKVVELFRREGFDGVMMTDSLVMQGLAERVDEAAVRALEAGYDLLILGGRKLYGQDGAMPIEKYRAIHAAIMKAVEEGRISEDRLNEAVGRVRELKFKLEEQGSILDRHIYRYIAESTASLGVEIVRGDPAFIEGKSVSIVASKALQGKVEGVKFFDTKAPEIDGDVIVVLSYNAWKDQAQAAVIQQLIDSGKDVVLVATRDALDGKLFPGAKVVCNTNSPTGVSVRAALKKIGI